MELDREDFQTLTQISTALWADATRAHAQASEALAAVSLLDLTPSRSMERWARAVLERARTVRDHTANPEALNEPVYRLLPHERLILAALHMGQWSYNRLSRVTGFSIEDVERTAWQARVHLAQQRLLAKGRGLQLPSAASGATRRSCPALEPDRPWTQRFLDEEVETRERLFLQNHLMACPVCSRALLQTRDVYFAAEEGLHAALERSLGEDDARELATELERTWMKMRRLRDRRGIFWSSIRSLLSRPDVVLVLAAAAVGIIFHASR